VYDIGGLSGGGLAADALIFLYAGFFCSSGFTGGVNNLNIIY
jgi:hypothetical protein